MATQNLQAYVSVPQLVLSHSTATQLRRTITGQTAHVHTFRSFSETSWNREIPYLNGLMLADKKSEKLLFETYFSKEHLERAKLVEGLLSDHRVTLVLGDPGCGKTTVLNYLYRYSDEMKEFRSSNEYIILTCNTDFVSAGEDGKETLTLYQWITAQFTSELIRIANKNGIDMQTVFSKDVDNKHFIKAINDALIRMKGEVLDDTRTAKVLLGLMRGPTYAKRLLDWFEEYQPYKKIAVVIDNLDCYSQDQKLECFANLLPALRRDNVRIVVPLRYGTELDHTDALHQYGQSPVKLSMDMPHFRQILKLRLTRLPPGITVKDQSESSSNILRKIWDSFSEKDAVTLFNGLFGANTRQKLEAFHDALKSFHFKIPDDYKNIDNFIRMLMLDEYCIRLEEFSQMFNVFDQGSRQGYQNTLARVRVLQCIQMNGNHYPIDNKTTITELSEAYDSSFLLETVNSLIRNGLVDVKGQRGINKLPESKKEVTYVTLNSIGTYYLDFLLKNRTYVALCAQSSLIPEGILRKVGGISIFKHIQQLLLEDEGLSELTNRLWNEWGDELFVSMIDFINYIASEEEKEGSKLSDKDFVSAISLTSKMRNDLLTTEQGVLSKKPM